MDISVRDLANVCGTNNALSEELVRKVDQLTHTFGIGFDKNKNSICTQVWDIIYRSLEFWQNASLLLTNAQFIQTKLQTLLLIQNKVKANWANQDITIRDGIKRYLCNQSQTYSQGQMTNYRKSLYRVINQIIVQILKYQWMNDWANFLFQICQAISLNDALAENYFDLLYVIFEDVFTQQQKLTSEEIKKIKQQIINNYNFIQKAYQQYLSPDKPKNILKNCLLSLNSLIQWLPSYYIYFGLIIDKLTHLFEVNNDMKIQILDCIITIFELPDNEMLEGILGKAYQKKRTTILTLLQNRNLKSNKLTTSKMLSLVQQFLKQQKINVEKFGQSIVFPDLGSKQNNKNILIRITDWINEQNQSDQNVINIYKFISAVTGQELGSLETLLQNVVNYAPCPLDIEYFVTQKIINVDFSDKSSNELQRKNYKQIVKNIVQKLEQSEYKRYSDYLKNQIGNQCTNLQSLKRLCRVVWNFYYFIQICPMSAKQMMVMQIINSLMNIQDRATQILMRIPNTPEVAGKRDYCFKLIGSIKICLVLLASLGYTIKQQLFKNPLFAYIKQGLTQSNDFIKSLLSIIKINYPDFQFEVKKSLNLYYQKAMTNRRNRLELDIEYIHVIGAWSLSNNSNIKLAIELLQVILQSYRLRFQQANNVNLSRRQDVEAAKKQLFQSGLNLLIFISESTPYLKNQIIFKTQLDLQKIKQTVTVCDLSGNDILSVLFYQKAAQVFTSNFQQLKKQQVSKNINVLVKQNLEICNFILQQLTSKKVCQEIVGSMLGYLGKLLYRIADWEFDEQHKLSLVERIISVVLGCNYSYETPNYLKFLHEVLRCNRFPCLSSHLINTVIHKIFAIATFETEPCTLMSIQMFKSLLNDSIGSDRYTELVTRYILDLTTNIYIIIIRQKSGIQYIKQFSNVLFLALVFIRNLKINFIPDQVSDNVTQLAKQLSIATKKSYFHYNDNFIHKIDNFIVFLLKLTSKQDFQDKLKDLLIVLRRGY